MIDWVEDWADFEDGYCPAILADKIAQDIVLFGNAVVKLENGKISIADLAKIGRRINKNLNKISRGRVDVMAVYKKFKKLED